VVRDSGIGILPEHQQKVFGPFERAVSPREFAGLGLGLFIVRQIVAAHGGTIQVDSARGEGSTFTVELPRGAPSSPAP
jgi:signal transduction histidine kinase